MQFVILSLLVFALYGANPSEIAPVEHASAKLLWCCWVILSELIGIACLARCARRCRSEADAADYGCQPQDHGRWLDRLTWGFTLFHAATVVGMISLAEWPRIVASTTSVRSIPIATELIVLIPVVGPLGAGWWLIGYWSREGGRLTRAAGSRRAVWLAGRLLIVPALVPMLTLCAIADMTSRRLVPLSDLTLSLAGAGLMVTFLVTIPWWFRLLWPTHVLEPGGLRERIESLMASAGVVVPNTQLRRWETGGRVVNALATGLIGQAHHLFLSDGLLQRLTTDQVAAVAAHELAHLQLRHPRRLMGSVVMLIGALLGWGLARSLLLPPPDGSQWVDGILIAVIGAVWAVAHGRFARQLEHEADWRACQLLAHPVAPTRATVQQLGLALLAADPSPRASWLHPSTMTRIHYLRQQLDTTTTQESFHLS